MRASGQSLKLWWGGPSRWLFGLGAAAFIAAMPAAPASGAAAKWYAANNGLDTSPCTTSMPCRSITRALTMAAPGDTIEVGPGIYGDIDGSGTLGDFPGEETSAGCMISITSRVTILSKDGAGSTVLDGAAMAVVCITTAGASGTVFGKLNKGFTIRNSAGTGPHDIGGTGLSLDGADGVKVEGNIAIGTQSGMSMGFAVAGSTLTKGATFKSNIASDWETGFFVGPTEGLVLTGNLATRNAGGIGIMAAFELQYPLTGGVVTKNSAIANLGPGFDIWDVSVPFTFSKNTALGNDTGVYVKGPGAVTLSTNNLFGNGDRGAGANCGLYLDNRSGSAPLTVNGSGNFWGAAAGPGANPADLAGGVGCSSDAGGGITLTTTPVAAAKFPLYPPKMK